MVTGQLVSYEDPVVEFEENEGTFTGLDGKELYF